nr:hypothetical protein [uncultured Brevundimonas sp.]
MPDTVIDVWDVRTFDPELLQILTDHTGLLRDYHTTARENLIQREMSDHTGAYPDNPFAGDHIDLTERLMPVMAQRTIRGWHYTRMTDGEVDRLLTEGIGLPSSKTIRARLNAQVAAGAFTAETADALHAASPFERGQDAIRSGRFWMVSHPRDIEDGGVELLLGNWGGEGVYFWLSDPDHTALVATIGRPRILEVAAPLSKSPHAFSAAEAVTAAFARSIGCTPEAKVFDLYVTAPLPPSAVLAVHTAGEARFEAVARNYPDGYRDTDLGRWDDIAAEIDRRHR